MQTFTERAQCTSNFVFSDGSSAYLGQAPYCSGTGSSADTNGCTSGSVPIGTPVDVTGASKPGTLVYDSWLTMQADRERDARPVSSTTSPWSGSNPADVPNVNPYVPGFGGPTRVGSVGGLGSRVYSYGKLGAARRRHQAEPEAGGHLREHRRRPQPRGLHPDLRDPGDSGSGFGNGSGRAIVVLSSLELAPTPAATGVGDLGNEIAYMDAHSPFGAVDLVPGTEPFNPNLVGAILGG